jgi:hypothetical protein
MSRASQINKEKETASESKKKAASKFELQKNLLCGVITPAIEDMVTRLLFVYQKD